jgi:hypothetical protein
MPMKSISNIKNKKIVKLISKILVSTCHLIAFFGVNVFLKALLTFELKI